jgi:hypothetical protein
MVGGSRTIRTAPLVLSALCAAVSACGNSVTGPLIPESYFTFTLQSRVDQQGPADTAGEIRSAVFDVHVKLGAEQTALARIDTVSVLWPDGRDTELDTVFTRAGSSLLSEAQVPMEGDMPAGTYTLRVHFDNGDAVIQEAVYDPHTIGRPDILNWVADTLSASLSWRPPAMSVDYRLQLAEGDSVLQSGVNGHVDLSSAGDTLGTGFNTHLESGTAYEFLLTLSDSTATRAVHVPFEVSQQ